MTALLLTLIGVLTLLVVGVAALALRLSGRIHSLEARLAASSDQNWSDSSRESNRKWSLDAPDPTRQPAQYVITHLGEPELEPEIEAVPTVAPGLFADLVLRETVVQTASLFHGVRRARQPREPQPDPLRDAARGEAVAQAASRGHPRGPS